jgi:osmoprotectant transport system permease protein
MGMTDRQVLWQVELPLSMSVILTGIRVAVVISFGVATIAAAVGAGGLGTYIFRGLRQNDNTLLLAGALPAALLALGADFLLGLVEKQLDVSKDRRRGRRFATRRILIPVFALVAALAITVFAFLRERPSNIKRAGASHVVVGTKDFTESVLLGEIVAQMLEKRGVEVERQFELGGNLVHDGLVAGRIDTYPEYTGTSFTAIFHHKPITDTQAVYEEVKREYAMQFNVDVSGPLGFSNDFAILIRGADAKEYNLKTISDASRFTPRWRAGFGQDFMSRQDGYPGFAKAYDLKFKEPPREMDLSLTYRALAQGQVDLIAGNSTDGLIAALDLFQLEDDKHYFPPYQAVLLTRKEKLAEVPELRETLARLAKAITTEEMRRLNYQIDGEKRNKQDVVRDWLKSKGF